MAQPVAEQLLFNRQWGLAAFTFGQFYKGAPELLVYKTENY